ncbi:unnamed protein product [Echinostoma caproni]|uniref:Secreted protein n=1 Tax=Echinostoma caproni TaxID=27848 RepID=A0A183B469_9TREM|nr:unnamed protein product [Echinostoma caproni]
MSRAGLVLRVTLFSLLISTGISAPTKTAAAAAAAAATTTTTTKSPKQIQQTAVSNGNTQTIIQPTNMFKDVPGMKVPMRPTASRRDTFQRDHLRPFEWLYKHLSNYLVCSYSEQPDCDKKLADSMRLEESITRLQNLNRHIHEKPFMDMTSFPMPVGEDSNAPIRNDFGFDTTEKKPPFMIDHHQPDWGMKPAHPHHPYPLEKEKKPMHPRMGDPFIGDPFMGFMGPIGTKLWPDWIKQGPEVIKPMEIFGDPHGPHGPNGPHGPQHEPWFRDRYQLSPDGRRAMKNEHVPPYPIMSMPLFVP